MSEQPPAPDTPPAGPNAAMAESWNGERGRLWVANAARQDRALAVYGRDVLDAAAIATTDRVLDIGCGTGWLTRAAAARARDGRAVGIDIGAPMVERARLEAAGDGPDNVTFEQADAQVAEFAPASVDVALSRFGVMFFDDPVAAFTNVRGALVDGGRLAFVCWRALDANDWLSVPLGALARHTGPPDVPGPDAPGPLSLAAPERIRSILDAAGFDDVALGEVAHPMWLGDSVEDAVGYMRTQSVARMMLESASEAAVAAALDELRRTLAGVAGPDGVVLPGSAWLVAARAV